MLRARGREYGEFNVYRVSILKDEIVQKIGFRTVQNIFKLTLLNCIIRNV